MNPESTIKLMITASDDTVLNLEIAPHRHLSPSRVIYRAYLVDNEMKRAEKPVMEMNHDHTHGELRLCERVLKRIQQNLALEDRRSRITPVRPTTKD